MIPGKKIFAAAAAFALMLGCGAARTGRLSAEAASPLDFELASVSPITLTGKTAADGTETFNVTVNVKSNPGVQSWVLLLGYDDSALEYSGISGKLFDGVEASAKNGVVTVNDFETSDVKGTGEAFTVTFKLKKGLTAGSYVFTLSPSEDKDNFFNYAESTVPCTVSSNKTALQLTTSAKKSDMTARVKLLGSESSEGVTLTVKDKNGSTVAKTVSVGAETSLGSFFDGSYTLTAEKTGYAPRSYPFKAEGRNAAIGVELCLFGDLNGDGEVRVLDYALIRQKLLGWSITVPYDAVIDVKYDGIFDLSDIAIFRQHLLGWKVAFGNM